MKYLFFPLQKTKAVTDEEIGGSLNFFVPRITINLTKGVNKTLGRRVPPTIRLLIKLEKKEL